MNADIPPPVATKLFQITEDDLAELERTLPRILDRMYSMLGKSQPGSNQLRTQWRRIQQIVADVRWNYGPPLDCETFPAGDEPPTETERAES